MYNGVAENVVFAFPYVLVTFMQSELSEGSSSCRLLIVQAVGMYKPVFHAQKTACLVLSDE